MTRWYRYIRDVKAFDRDKLVELIAEVSCDQMDKEQAATTAGSQWEQQGVLLPFVLAGVARDALLDGFSKAKRSPRSSDLERLCSQYLDLEDAVADPAAPYGSVARYMVRVAYEQFPYQVSPFFELARSWALFADTAAQVNAPTMTEEAWRRALRCGLDEYIWLAFAWHASAATNRGWVDPGFQDPVQIHELRSSAEALAAVSQRLSASPNQLKQDPGIEVLPDNLRKYRYNPLLRRPFVRLGGRLLAPIQQLARRRTSPEGLYYDRVQDPRFTDDLGDVFEAYIGRQLATLENAGLAAVLPKIQFDRGNGREESIDWFVVFPDVVLLVEAKATRLAAEARLGLDRLGPDVDRTLGVAYDQIGKTADLIRSGQPEFLDLPTDRPMLGLVVTLEPYWLLWHGTHPVEPENIRVHPVSCGEIEAMVGAALVGPITDVFLRLTTESGTGGRRFVTAFEGKRSGANPILDAAYDRVFGVD
jgi:hypothetical protein